MGWTHDHGDTARERRSATVPGTHDRGAGREGHDPRLGIPRILRRRARWVSARLRHPRV
ncbi:hypothetical protein GCM10010302_73040 [Streptomyces polychromogenes]|uniref:Uncharacterized protein n=1 Tax=Streptomyces polychromogenes TaxID=67342 RepID=A0ABN0W2C1_9ACTN|nr:MULTISPECIES: hypothetical protein [Streptomyces]MCF3179001.1 hypothetical protein [Streptomyces polychromogenes]